VEEKVEVPREENTPLHQNWLLKVKIDNTRADKGAVHTFTRTDATGVTDGHFSTEVSGCTRVPHLRQQTKREIASSMVVHNTKVTDVDSQITVGSFPRRRETSSTSLASQNLEIEVFAGKKTTFGCIDYTHVNLPNRAGLGS
jgi:hypothetical protein